MDDPESYLAHPVNAYLLTKQLTTDLKQVESLILSGPSAYSSDILNDLI